MDRAELQEQYNRFISQLREEVNHLYWLFNFFFLVEGGFMAFIFLEKASKSKLLIIQVFGLLSSIYWFWILRKQIKSRNNWYERVYDIETALQFDNEQDPKKVRMWPKDESSFVFGSKGLWRALFLIPLLFIVMYSILLILSVLPLLCSL